MAKTDKSSTENPLINIDEETKKWKRISLNVVDYHKTILDLLAS